MEDLETEPKPKFQLSKLSLTLANGTTLLHEISLTFPAGQISGVIGPSGSGKSTLLRCLNRLWEPPTNTVFLDGQDITTLNVLTLRRQVGMLFQEPALFAGTVAENIAYGPKLQKKVLTDEEISALLKMVGLSADMAGRPTIELSGGEAQRVALARALANQPQVLLLDEPTSALDPAATRQVEETIFRLRDELGLTVIWVSHAVEQVARTANWVVLLSMGRVIETGSPAHLLESDQHHLFRDFAKGKLED